MIMSFQDFLEDAQGPDNVAARRPPDKPEQIFQPRSTGERSFFDWHWSRLKKQDYPLPVEGQFKGRTSTAQLPHDGYDPKVPGEREPKKHPKAPGSSPRVSAPKRRGSGYGETSPVKQGSSTVKDSPVIREADEPSQEDVYKFRQRHERKSPAEMRAYARRHGLRPWMAAELRMMSLRHADNRRR